MLEASDYRVGHPVRWLIQARGLPLQEVQVDVVSRYRLHLSHIARSKMGDTLPPQE